MKIEYNQQYYQCEVISISSREELTDVQHISEGTMMTAIIVVMCLSLLAGYLL
jgi:hypothetical protein